jgi:Ser/Thr protein kinase RdoA (MazF antagonist)
VDHHRPFVVEPVGAADDARPAALAAARHWSLDEPELLRVGMNAIFRAGADVVLRVGRPTAPAEAAIELAAMLSAEGIHVPRAAATRPFEHDGYSVWALEHVESRDPVDWRSVGAMVAKVHRLPPEQVAALYPLPPMAELPLWRFDELMADVDDMLDSAARNGLRAAISRHDRRSEWRAATVCHGDVHPGNVLQSHDGPVLLDWDLMCAGAAGWDHAPLIRLHERWGGDEGVYEAFADGYGSTLRGHPVAEALAELRLVAATLMRLRAARREPRAWPEAALRLRYWRGEADPPAWTAQ